MESSQKHGLGYCFFTDPGVLDPEELFGSLKIDENEIDVEVNRHKHCIKTRPSKMSARPNFAWDDAFSTDPGVLDAEELSLVINGFNSNTELRKSADSMTKTTERSRFSVTSIEFDLFHDMRTSLRKSQAVTREMQCKLTDGKKRIIPKPKVFSSSSFISKPLTPSQVKSVKKSAASELGRKREKHKKFGFEEQSGSKSSIRSSYSGYTVKDGIFRLGMLWSEVTIAKDGIFRLGERREPNRIIRRNKSKLETSSTPQNRSVLGQRKTRK